MLCCVVIYCHYCTTDPVVWYEIFCRLCLLELFQFYCSLWRVFGHEVSVSAIEKWEVFRNVILRGFVLNGCEVHL